MYFEHIKITCVNLNITPKKLNYYYYYAIDISAYFHNRLSNTYKFVICGRLVVRNI